MRLSFLVTILFFAAGISAQDDFPNKKFIELGWDMPNTAYLKEHHEEMQRTTPLDGVILSLEGTAPDGKKYSSKRIMDAQSWDPAWFAQAVDDLKACRWTTFTDNFLCFNFSPGTIAWDDDEGWTNLCNKTALCAQIAKETGLKGFSADFEPYGKRMFQYSTDSGRSFEETLQLARKRGKQWMEAIASQYPDMVLFTLFIADFYCVPAGYDVRPEYTLKPHHYGLLPAFFDGMLDAVPSKMRIVDGCETGYYLNGYDEFCRSALAIRSNGGPAIRLVAPENREKYINQVQVGFGFYLDMYTNPEGHKYYRGPKDDGTRLDRLEENLSAALKAADQYVWLYGERYCWWKPVTLRRNQEDVFWDEALPGMDRTIRLVKKPWEAAKAELETLRKENQMVNLLKNADFSESLKDKPSDWYFWQEKPLGKVLSDDGSAKVSGVQSGCMMQGVKPVKPGEYYYVAIDGKRQGAGQIGMQISWGGAVNYRTRFSEERNFSFEKESSRIDSRPLPEGWLRAEGVVRVPEGCDALQFKAAVQGQSTDTDVAWFDDAVLVRLNH